jgi:CMP-N,N'-diacetyllegionaminic acid synthase
LDIPFLRPPELSTDSIGDMPVIKHGLIEFQKLNSSEYEMIIMLQPTSPIRTINQVTQALQLMRKSNFDSIISISKVDKKYNPLKQFSIERQRLIPFSAESKNIFSRQQLSDSYIRNGVLYIFKPEFVINSESVFSDNSGYTIIDEPYINIDSPEDILTFEEFLQIN